MEEIIIKIGSKKYTLNDNGDKYDRAVREAGMNASPEKILAIYDSFDGLIKDEEGTTIKNGSFCEAYKRLEEERPKYIKILEERQKSLDEGENRTMELSGKNIDHKRGFLGTLMTIAAAILVGLFILLTTEYVNESLSYFWAAVSGIGFATFLVGSTIYLGLILSQESVSIDKHLKFVRDSRRDFIGKVGIEITDIDSYERYREKKYMEEKELHPANEVKGSAEFWFRLIVGFFVLSSALLFAVFLRATILRFIVL